MVTLLNKLVISLMVLVVLISYLLVYHKSHIEKVRSKWNPFIPPAIYSFINKNMTKNGDDDKKSLKETEDSFSLFLKNHSVFKTFNVSRVYKKNKRVHVLVIVSTAPKRRDRRDSIRKTWWKRCLQTKKVIPECIFMTDIQQPNSIYHNAIQKEQQIYGDLRFQDLKGGIQFGVRYLNHVLFSFLNYDFDYMLRMDDDYFLCMDRFLSELPVPMEPMFHWGWTHCNMNIVRPEESMLLFSKDLLMHFLKQDPQSMKCHPWADQMIGAWTQDLKMKKVFRHDSRLHHTPLVSQKPSLRKKNNLCQKYMGIHGCYAKDMLLLWKHRGLQFSSKGTLKTNSKHCKTNIGNSRFRWDKFGGHWRYEPKPCISNPVWDTSKQGTPGSSYGGRQEGKW